MLCHGRRSALLVGLETGSSILTASGPVSITLSNKQPAVSVMHPASNYNLAASPSPVRAKLSLDIICFFFVMLSKGMH